MKTSFITFLLAFSAIYAFGQVPGGRMVERALDTNRIVYDEHDNPLRYYQYTKLITSGEYTMRTDYTPGSQAAAKTVLVKLTDEDKLEMYERMKPMITIKQGFLKEGNVLDLKPLLDELNGESVDKKAVLLIFWNVGCPPCTSSFGNLNDLFKNVNSPDLVSIAIALDKKDEVTEQLKKTPLNATHILNNAFRINGAYGVHQFPAFVLTDKDHVIKMAVNGSSPIVIPVLARTIKEVLGK